VTSRWLRTYAGHGCSSSRRRLAKAVPGFTLIEVVVAMAILLVVMIGVLSAISFAYTSSTDTEMRNIATNVASYTPEYLRARTITRGNTTLYNLVNPTNATTGTYAWYVPGVGNNPTGALPSMIDIGNLPLQSNGYPCNYTSAYVRTGGIVDESTNFGSSGGIGAAGAVIRFASKHAVSPTQTYADQPLAFTTTLQGYVSVQNMTAPASTQDPAPEDKNLAQMKFSGGNDASGTYRTKLVDLVPRNDWTDLVVRYPGVYLATPPALAITSFTPGATYVANVYTTDPTGTGKVAPSNQTYNPYYTNDSNKKAVTQDYRGFRVLTQVVARTAAPATYSHVQYYDVTVTVLWMSGTHESNYELVSQIAAY